jgi:hypothetical protein
MTSEDFMKVWELGKGRNQSRRMMAVVPDQSAFPFLTLQGEEFIRKHYLQVRALYIERARLENIQKKENPNEKTS